MRRSAFHSLLEHRKFRSGVSAMPHMILALCRPCQAQTVHKLISSYRCKYLNARFLSLYKKHIRKDVRKDLTALTFCSTLSYIRRGSMKYWQPTELIAVLAAARKESTRNHLIVLLAYKNGLRASEVAGLKLTDVAHGRCDVHRLKGSDHTNQPLESHENPLLDEKRALAAYLRERPDTSSVFLFVSEFGPRCGSGLSRQSIHNIFQDAAAAALIEPGRRHPHCAKHTRGTLL